ncbi:unnamed protein product [Caenorhabditis auriculariae]|uniref:Protein-tyrosine-phosphatase n=1 Tax=Caenorhabditis auriculariae TaxID=2777116 RepID=A0A8S1HHE7_9PELO|nr:unnamed protein product [Caenorhabditis auriculariae]
MAEQKSSYNNAGRAMRSRTPTVRSEKNKKSEESGGSNALARKSSLTATGRQDLTSKMELPTCKEKSRYNIEDPRHKWATKVLEKTAMRVVLKEFRDMKDWKPDPFLINLSKKNSEKNRYDDIHCLDHTRVVLKERPSGKDYIHASWMVMPDGFRYISTQGPLKETLDDFWHMIYTEKCSVIVMLCQWDEGAHEKCRRYYQRDRVENYGDYKVRVKKDQEEPFKTIRLTLLECQRKGSKEWRTVYHFWCYEWEDHAGPLDAGPVVSMHKMSLEKAEGNPIVVHCSAGIGRTATFVGINYASQRIQEDPDLKMVDILRGLRKMRHRAIQSQLQYAFLYVCVFELFCQEGVLSRDGKVKEFRNKYAGISKNILAKMKEAQEKEREKEKTRA